MDTLWIVLFLLFVAWGAWYLNMKNECRDIDDFTTGFAVTSGLAMNNPLSVQIPPGAYGPGYAGASVIPGHVIW